MEHHRDTTDIPTLGWLIRRAREAQGLSRRQLADRVGMHHSSLSPLEQGRVSRPTAALLQRLAEQLQLPLRELYALAGVPVPPLRPYLRARYGLSATDSAKAEAYIARLVTRSGGTGTGPLDGDDETPEDN